MLLTFWDDVAGLTSARETVGHILFKGDKGVGSPQAPVNRRDKNVQSPGMTALRFFLYFVDAISLRLAANKALKSGSDVIIFDRYTYDELANLKLNRRLVRLYASLILKMVPTPDVSFFLDADPVQAPCPQARVPCGFSGHLPGLIYVSMLLGRNSNGDTADVDSRR